LEAVHDLHSLVGQLFTAISEHPQRLELTIRREDAQPRGAHGDDRDRVRI
jgi:hypothetical protein